MYVCVCKAVTDSQIKRAIDEGANSRRCLYKSLGVGGDCGKCNLQVKEILVECHKNNHSNVMQNSPNHSILAA